MKKITAKPEFCPNLTCRFYNRTTAASHSWYISFGKYYTQCRGWIARFRCRVIQNRVRRLARNSLSVMDVLLSDLKLSEEFVMDGFESYTRSQYHPNNFTTIVGSDSQFFYAVIHTLLRGKGAMKRYQKSKCALIASMTRHGLMRVNGMPGMH